jgi:lipopolysaccharide transport system permease protein
MRTVIEERRPGLHHRVRELWRYRRMIWFFGKRFLERRYRRTILGWIWIPLRPTLTIASRVLIFGGLLAVPSNGVPYLIFFLVGYATWDLFASYLIWATRSLEINRKLLKRLYFPRLVLPVAALVPSVVEFAVYVVLAVLVLLYYWVFRGEQYVHLTGDLLLVPAGLALCIALAFAIGLSTSVLSANARDVRFTLNYLIGFWSYLTPVIYPLSAVPGRFALLASLNPLTAPVEMVKQGAIGAGEIHTHAVLITLAMIGGALTLGLWFFGKAEASAIDRL